MGAFSVIVKLQSSRRSVSGSTSHEERSTVTLWSRDTTAAPASSTAASSASALADDVLLHHVDDLIRDAEVLDGAAADVALGHPPELVPVPAGADHLPEVDVHPVVAAHQVPVVCLPILELHQHGMVLSSPEER